MNHPYLSLGFEPLRTEYDDIALAVTGELPPSLCGTLYRIGPNPQFAPRGRYNPLQGDGMIHAFHIEHGAVTYRNRWVRTQQWQLENAAGKALFATSGNPADADPAVAGMRTDGTANTSLVWHAQRLLALEEGHAPIEIEPRSLATLRAWSFGGALTGNMTAHPKIDPASGELLLFANFPRRDFAGDLDFHVADAAGRFTRSEVVRGPFPALVHDFAITADFVIFAVCPATLSLARLRAGGPPLAWEPECGTHAGVLPRHGNEGEVRWFRAASCMAWHVMNTLQVMLHPGCGWTLYSHHLAVLHSGCGSNHDPRSRVCIGTVCTSAMSCREVNGSSHSDASGAAPTHTRRRPDSALNDSAGQAGISAHGHPCEAGLTDRECLIADHVRPHADRHPIGLNEPEQVARQVLVVAVHSLANVRIEQCAGITPVRIALGSAAIQLEGDGMLPSAPAERQQHEAAAVRRKRIEIHLDRFAREQQAQRHAHVSLAAADRAGQGPCRIDTGCIGNAATPLLACLQGRDCDGFQLVLRHDFELVHQVATVGSDPLQPFAAIASRQACRLSWSVGPCDGSRPAGEGAAAWNQVPTALKSRKPPGITEAASIHRHVVVPLVLLSLEPLAQIEPAAAREHRKPACGNGSIH